MAPAKKLAVVACMDARLDVHRVLGLQEGDAHVIRNAGGIVTDDVIRSLMLSQRLLGTREIVLLHHTECGLLNLQEDAVKREIESEVGAAPPFALGSFADVEQDVRDSMQRIAASPFIPHKSNIRGFVYDVRTRSVHEVAANADSVDLSRA